MGSEGWPGIPPRVYQGLRLCTKCLGFAGQAMPHWDAGPAEFRVVRGADGVERRLQISGTGDLPLYFAYCDCDATPRVSNRVSASTEVFGEGNCGYEFCRVCALQLIDTRSKWAFIVCPECRPVVRLANEFAGRLLIPVGRHSIVNASGAAGRFPKLPDSLREVLARPEILVEAARTMSVGFDLLASWRPRVIEQNLQDSGLLAAGRPAAVALDEYFVACAQAGLLSEQRAVQMVRSMRPWG